MNAQLDGEFREFMQARWPTMVRLAYGLTGDQGHAEDVAQTAFARAYASWPRISRSGNPDAYVPDGWCGRAGRSSRPRSRAGHLG
jgi:DNA-directed RNA polymerase specialized sigma24 family protein